MSKLPSIELIESTHTLPGPYTFKAIGKVEENFLARVVAAIRDELGEATDPPYQTRESEGGKHIAVTFELYMETGAQVHEIYERILKVRGLVLVL